MNRKSHIHRKQLSSVLQNKVDGHCKMTFIVCSFILYYHCCFHYALFFSPLQISLDTSVSSSGQHINAFDYDCSLFPVPHMVRAMASSQSIPIPQGASVQDRAGRNRQPSECVRTRTLFSQLWLGDRGLLSLRRSWCFSEYFILYALKLFSFARQIKYRLNNLDQIFTVAKYI